MKDQDVDILKHIQHYDKPIPKNPNVPNYWTHPEPELWILHTADGTEIGHSRSKDKPNDSWEVRETTYHLTPLGKEVAKALKNEGIDE